MMVKMMKKVVEGGTATPGAASAARRPGKTGTSQNWRDAWFVGFTPDYVAGVWVGNDDDKPMNKVTGGDILAADLAALHAGRPPGLPVRDFDWLLPDPAPLATPDPRNGFYETLAGGVRPLGLGTGAGGPAGERADAGEPRRNNLPH